MSRVEAQLTPERFARERDALIGRIAAGLAHDLNGPIGIVIGFNELIATALNSVGENEALPADTAAKLRDYADLIEGAAARARSLTSSIWDFARLSPGTSEQLDMNVLVEEAARLAAPSIRGPGVELVSPESGDDVAESTVTLTGDRALILSAFVSLFMTSPSALPSGGQATWQIKSADPTVAGIHLSTKIWEGDPGTEWPVELLADFAITQAGGQIQSGDDSGSIIVNLPSNA